MVLFCAPIVTRMINLLYHERYKLNAIVKNDTGSANFTIFGRLAQDLIHISAQNLATSAGSDKFTLPPAIKTIIGHKHIFQIVPDVQRFRTSVPSFEGVKIFNIQYDIKENTSSAKNLIIKCEEKADSPTTQKEIHKELFEEASPSTTISLSSPPFADDIKETQPAKKKTYFR
ncbi:uncharacterized protein LOC109727912 [Ananas comosus]|uniref:Uncharacterized protein LOC109727912 n=1 Tax=Ananas comosus TaxID=4615 RepID=A0A6P5H109_ANACO|nr:uncharacterized protein LOC109727912 [Ananas comosus]